MRPINRDRDGMAPIVAGLVIVLAIISAVTFLSFYAMPALFAMLGAMCFLGIVPFPNFKIRVGAAAICFILAYALYSGVI